MSRACLNHGFRFSSVNPVRVRVEHGMRFSSVPSSDYPRGVLRRCLAELYPRKACRKGSSFALTTPLNWKHESDLAAERFLSHSLLFSGPFFVCLFAAPAPGAPFGCRKPRPHPVMHRELAAQVRRALISRASCRRSKTFWPSPSSLCPLRRSAKKALQRGW